MDLNTILFSSSQDDRPVVLLQTSDCSQNPNPGFFAPIGADLKFRRPIAPHRLKSPPRVKKEEGTDQLAVPHTPQRLGPITPPETPYEGVGHFVAASPGTLAINTADDVAQHAAVQTTTSSDSSSAGEYNGIVIQVSKVPRSPGPDHGFDELGRQLHSPVITTLDALSDAPSTGGLGLQADAHTFLEGCRLSIYSADPSDDGALSLQDWLPSALGPQAEPHPPSNTPNDSDDESIVLPMSQVPPRPPRSAARPPPPNFRRTIRRPTTPHPEVGAVTSTRYQAVWPGLGMADYNGPSTQRSSFSESCWLGGARCSSPDDVSVSDAPLPSLAEVLDEGDDTDFPKPFSTDPVVIKYAEDFEKAVKQHIREKVARGVQDAIEYTDSMNNVRDQQWRRDYDQSGMQQRDHVQRHLAQGYFDLKQLITGLEQRLDAQYAALSQLRAQAQWQYYYELRHHPNHSFEHVGRTLPPSGLYNGRQYFFTPQDQYNKLLATLGRDLFQDFNEDPDSIAEAQAQRYLVPVEEAILDPTNTALGYTRIAVHTGDMLKDVVPLGDVGDVLSFMRQIIRALCRLHFHKVAHGNLTMSHIAAYAEIPHGRRYAILLNFKNLSDSFELDSMLDIANLRIIFEAEVVQKYQGFEDFDELLDAMDISRQGEQLTAHGCLRLFDLIVSRVPFLKNRTKILERKRRFQFMFSTAAEHRAANGGLQAYSSATDLPLRQDTAHGGGGSVGSIPSLPDSLICMPGYSRPPAVESLPTQTTLPSNPPIIAPTPPSPEGAVSEEIHFRMTESPEPMDSEDFVPIRMDNHHQLVQAQPITIEIVKRPRLLSRLGNALKSVFGTSRRGVARRQDPPTRNKVRKAPRTRPPTAQQEALEKLKTILNDPALARFKVD